MSLGQHRRRAAAEEDTDINLVPVMNMFLVLIPFLLTSASFLHLKAINTSVPVQAERAAAAPAEKPEVKVTVVVEIPVSVARAIERETGLSVECKWPNDLLLNKRKVAGILLENSVSHKNLAYSVAGIGLNVGEESFPEHLQDKATSLSRETGEIINRAALLRRILTEMEELYGDVRSQRFERILKEWNSRCTMFGKNITVMQHDHRLHGSAVGLSSEGGLILATATGTETVYAGEVTVIS